MECELVQRKVFSILFSLIMVLLLAFSSAGHAATDVPKIISLLPASPDSVPVGQSVTLKLTATSANPLNYQWYKNGVIISGATSAAYTTSPVTSTTSVNYTVKVSNSGNSVTSTAIAVKGFYDVPSISSLTPVSPYNVSVGQSQTLNVVAGSAYALTYQWYFNGYVISGANAASYTLSPILYTSAGVYTVKVSNAGNSVTSHGIIIGTGVSPQPISVTTPGAFTLSPGGMIAFRVSPISGATYNWFKNNVPIPGARLNVYQIPSIQSSDAGQYMVNVTFGPNINTGFRGSSTLTSPMQLTVGSGTTVPLSIVQQAPTANTMEAAYPNSLQIYVTGDRPTSMQWFQNGQSISGSNSLILSIRNVQINHAGTYTFQATSNQRTITSQNYVVQVGQVPTFTEYPAPFQFVYPSIFAPLATSAFIATGQNINYNWLENGQTFATGASKNLGLGTYQIATYSNPKFKMTGYPINVVGLSPDVPTITGFSGRYTYSAGETISLTVNAVGGKNTTFQWKNPNGQVIKTATTSTLTIPYCSDANAGTYSVTVSDAIGDSVQASVSLNVLTDSDAPLTASNLAVIVNDNDPYSTQIAAYYQNARHIPAKNMIHISIGTPGSPPPSSINRNQFAVLNAQILAALPSSANIQAFAVAWTYPSTVECNSFTGALSRGFDPEPCGSAGTCSLFTDTEPNPSPFYGSNSHQPFTTAGFRPSMMLAARTLAEGLAMIARGVASDGTTPVANAYVLNTPDSVRSVRAANLYQDLSWPVGYRDSSKVNLQVVNGKSIYNTSDAMFLFTGYPILPNLSSNAFPPGAIADNLTSYGGSFGGTSQTVILDLISQGLTGSFGTATEPCAYTEKFPEPRVVVVHYSHGDTLIEAYWKSVQVTFQGVFVGEPLAAPYRPRIAP
jgi:uncharacterized protein (TIGR03790 family)